MKQGSEADAILEFELATPAKEISAFETTTNQTSTNANLTEMMNVSFQNLAKPVLELSNEENGPDLNRPLSEMMSDATELSKTQH